MKVLFQTKVPLQWVPALLKSLVFVAVMTAVFGVLYPAAVTGVALLFPAAREGNLVQFEGRVVGSRLIGQDFGGRTCLPDALRPTPYRTTPGKVGRRTSRRVTPGLRLG